MHISYSRFSLYLSCPYAHYLRYVKRLELDRPIRPLYFGTDFHKLLELRGDQEALKEAMKNIEDAFYELPPSWQQDLGENYPEDLKSIFKDYQQVYQGAKLPTVTEKEFELKIGSYKGEPVYFVGKIDELYKLKRKGEKVLKLGEHKTFSRRPDMAVLTMNTQKCLYAKAAQMLYGVLPLEIIWDYVKSTPAKEPIWLEKSQRFSLAKSSDITTYSWLRACEERGITDKSVIESGKELYKFNTENFFFRVNQDIYPQMVETIWDGFVYTCKQIVKEGEKNKTKNVTRDCTFCSYRDICFSEMSGGDTDYVIKNNYHERGHREEETNGDSE